MTAYKISKDLFLEISGHCDRKTLSNLLQTNKEVHALISGHEQSISIAKLKNCLVPPQSFLLTSKNEQRSVIPKMNTFATVQELELREMRVCSLIDRGGFFLTEEAKVLGMTKESLVKFKSGLKKAIYLADRLADAAADPVIASLNHDILKALYSLQLANVNVGDGRDDDLGSDESAEALRDAEFQAYVEMTTALRNKQAQILSQFSTLDLAFLLTVNEGAVVGWQRYMAKYASVDDRFFNKMDAFGELVFREGSFILWAFVRGTGSLYAAARTAVTVVADQIWRYEAGLDQSDPGLSMALHSELKKRLLESAPEDDPLHDDEAQLDEKPLLVKQWAHKLVGKAIGFDGWKGYYATELPLSQ